MSADAQARGEALTASVDDAAAVWYNPAALAGQRANISVNSNNLFYRPEYTDASGRTWDSSDNYFPLFGAYAAIPLVDGKFSLGLGVNTPFGLAMDYDGQAPFRYVATKGELEVFNISPALSWSVRENLSLGIAVNHYKSSLSLGQKYPWAAVLATPGLSDGDVDVNLDGNGWGFSSGVLWSPSEGRSIGLTYHSQVAVDYRGNASLSGVPFAGSIGVDAVSSIRFPDAVSVGYAVENERWRAEVGGRWTNWNDLDSLDVNFAPNALLPDSKTRLDWRNAWAVRAGAEYRLSDGFSLAGGYFFDKSPVREARYYPLLPDADHHTVSLSPVWRMGDVTLRTPFVLIIPSGYGTVNSEISDALGTQVDGDYDAPAFQIGVGATVRFG